MGNISGKCQFGWVLAGMSLGLAACGQGEFSDLNQFIADTNRATPRGIEAAPDVVSPMAANYDGLAQRDPFGQIVVEAAPAPVKNWLREPLESFSLASLKIVGTMKKRGVLYALVAAPDGVVHQAGAGAHIGENFGVITGIGELKIRVRELVPDGDGAWIERLSELHSSA